MTINCSKYFSVPLFDTAEGIEQILAPMPGYEEFLVNKYKLYVKYNDKVSVDMRVFYKYPLITREQEYHLFRQMNYYKYLISMDKNKEINCKKLMEVKDLIIGCNMRLVLNIVKNQLEFKNNFKDNTIFEDLISDGSIALVRACDHFDYRRGFKFSTYATYAIVRHIYRERDFRFKFGRLHSTNIDEAIFSNLFTKGNLFEEGVIDNKEFVSNMLRFVNDPYKSIIQEIFFEGKTLAEVGSKMNVSSERVRQMKMLGIKKMKAMFEEPSEKICL